MFILNVVLCICLGAGVSTKDYLRDKSRLNVKRLSHPPKLTLKSKK